MLVITLDFLGYSRVPLLLEWYRDHWEARWFSRPAFLRFINVFSTFLGDEKLLELTVLCSF